MDTIVKKSAAGRVADSPTFVLSHESVDRVGDIVVQAGWDLKSFLDNPVALMSHKQGDMPVGIWRNLRVEGPALLGDLQLAAKGTSREADLARELIQQGILRAVSVGFRPIAAEPLKPRGMKYLSAELLECSLVSVPCNGKAVLVAKSLGMTETEMSNFFDFSNGEGEQASVAVEEKQAKPEQGRSEAKPTVKKEIPMNITSTLSERIQAQEKSLVAKRDQLVALSAQTDDESAQEQIKEVASAIAAEEKSLASMKLAEQTLAKTSAPAVMKSEHRGEKAGIDLLVKSAVCAFEANIRHISPEQVAAERYGNDNAVKAVTDVVCKVATPISPAMTSVANWAQELVRDSYGSYMDALQAESFLARLGLERYSFDGYNSIKIPVRNATPNLAGKFVGEGNPIPLGKLGFSSKTLTPKKLGIISTFTSELLERSTPNIEQIVRNAMLADTAQALDTAFISNAAATAIRPAGITNGLAAGDTRASAGVTSQNIITDLRAMVASLTSQNLGRRCVWLMSPQRASGLAFAATAAGDWIFRSEVQSGNLLGFPIVISNNVPAAEVFLLDAAEIGMAGGAPQFAGTSVATLHEEGSEADVKPIVGGTAAAPAAAAPVRSLFQTDTHALRSIWYVDWAVLRAGAVQHLTTVAW